MATLLGPTKISSTMDSYNRVQMHFFRYSPGDVDAGAGDYYIHLKTNIPRYSSAMYMIEAVGYNYGIGQSIRCAWTGYMYNDPGYTVYAPNQFQGYPGLTAHGQYVSSDNFLVLRATAATLRWPSFTLSAYQMNPVPVIDPVRITATAANLTSGAHF